MSMWDESHCHCIIRVAVSLSQKLTFVCIRNPFMRLITPIALHGVTNAFVCSVIILVSLYDFDWHCITHFVVSCIQPMTIIAVANPFVLSRPHIFHYVNIRILWGCIMIEFNRHGITLFRIYSPECLIFPSETDPFIHEIFVILIMVDVLNDESFPIKTFTLGLGYILRTILIFKCFKLVNLNLSTPAIFSGIVNCDSFYCKLGNYAEFSPNFILHFVNLLFWNFSLCFTPI